MERISIRLRYTIGRCISKHLANSPDVGAFLIWVGFANAFGTQQLIFRIPTNIPKAGVFPECFVDPNREGGLGDVMLRYSK